VDYLKAIAIVAIDVVQLKKFKTLVFGGLGWLHWLFLFHWKFKSSFIMKLICF